ncbi:serine/threonine-protein kinase TOR-like [Capsicum chacoense]
MRNGRKCFNRLQCSRARVCGCYLGCSEGSNSWLFEKKLLRHCVRAFVLLKSVRQGGVFSGIIECLRLPKMDWGEMRLFTVYMDPFSAVGELLRNTGEFMMSRYREVAEIILRYLEHRDRLICMNHILHVLKIPAERASGFIALGEMAGALDGELINYLPTISSHLRDAIAPRRGRPSLEALACVGNIAKAMGPTMEPHVRGLLDSMFSSGLSLTLVEALEQITESIPPLLPTIQNRLLEFISTILSRSHHSMPRQSASVSRGHITTGYPQVPELSGSALVQLALRTLAHFNFKGHDLLEFARESVVVYLEDEDGATRKDAALCCCKLVANSFSAISSTQFSPSRINRASGKRRHRVVEEVAGISLGVLILGCMPGLGPKFSICYLLPSSHKLAYFLFIGRFSPKFAHVNYFLHSKIS